MRDTKKEIVYILVGQREWYFRLRIDYQIMTEPLCILYARARAQNP